MESSVFITGIPTKSVTQMFPGQSLKRIERKYKSFVANWSLEIYDHSLCFYWFIYHFTVSFHNEQTKINNSEQESDLPVRSACIFRCSVYLMSVEVSVPPPVKKSVLYQDQPVKFSVIPNIEFVRMDASALPENSTARTVAVKLPRSNFRSLLMMTLKPLLFKMFQIHNF